VLVLKLKQQLLASRLLALLMLKLTLLANEFLFP
jgi:hypothetical protein